MAHELNNPLSFVKGFNERIKASVLKKGSVSLDDIGELIDEVDRGAERMRKIIQHFRDFSRQSDNILKDCNVKEIIERSFKLFIEQLKLKSIEVEFNFCEKDILVKVDPNRLEQVFVNLISNSRDALNSFSLIPKDTFTKKITAKCECDGQFCHVQFSDNGPGVPKEKLDRIFDPFFYNKRSGTRYRTWPIYFSWDYRGF